MCESSFPAWGQIADDPSLRPFDEAIHCARYREVSAFFLISIVKDQLSRAFPPQIFVDGLFSSMYSLLTQSRRFLSPLRRRGFAPSNGSQHIHKQRERMDKQTRREFLKTAAVGATVITAASAALPRPAEHRRKWRYRWGPPGDPKSVLMARVVERRA